MNTIIISLTRGLFGDKIKELCKVSDENNTVSLKELTTKFFKAIEDFKNSDEAKENYKVEMYCRLIQNGEDHSKIAIDFGDYSTFILAENVPPQMLFPG